MRHEVLNTLLIVLVLGPFFTPLPEALAAVNGTLITNTARFSYAEGFAISSSVDVQVVLHTRSILELFQHLANPSNPELIQVSATDYAPGSDLSLPFATLAAPVTVGASSPLDLSQPLPLVPATAFHQGEPIFLRLTDFDQNLDATKTDTALVTIICADTGDLEVLRLVETAANSGTFAGYVPTQKGTALSYDGIITVASGAEVEARYVDAFDGSDASITAVLVDPLGVVFDTQTGQPVNGATISLLDALSGEPAQVFGDDGISSYPSTVFSGGRVTDSSGAVYEFADGNYRFPFVEPGSYRLQIEPPAGYSAPSAKTILEIQALPGGPFALLDPGSFGGVFQVVPGPPLRVDLPIDPHLNALWVRKSADRQRVAIGDFVPYQVTVENTLAVDLQNALLTDRLPLGFRFQKGSVRIDGAAAADPQTFDNGRTLGFALGDMAAETAITLSYIVEVAAGARRGQAINRAWATADGGRTSNQARASVEVGEDLLRSSTILMGEVLIGPCGEEPPEGRPGLAGVRIFLEDGTFTLTDQQGRYHFEGVRPGVHVVQLDLDSLPEGYRPLLCTPNTRFAGRAFSRFVDLQGGTLWRSDFYVVGPEKPQSAKEPAPTEKAASAAAPRPSEGIVSHLDGMLLEYRKDNIKVRLDTGLKPRLLLNGTEVPDERIGATTQDEKAAKSIYRYDGIDFGQPGEHTLKIEGIGPFGNVRFEQAIKLTLPADAKESAPIDDQPLAPVGGEKPQLGILSHQDRMLLANRVNTLRVRLDSGLKPRLLLDGTEVSNERIGFQMKEAGNTTLYSYIGIDFGGPGVHHLQLQGLGPFGNARFEQSLQITRTGEIAALRLLDSRGNIADGRTPIKVRLELRDTAGNPIQAPALLELREGNLVPHKSDSLELAQGSGTPLVEVNAEGYALFAPTHQSGTYRAVLAYNEISLPIETYVAPQMRDWVLVGLAEGTVGYNTVSGHMESLEETDIEESFYSDGRLAFFAKGKIKGQWLLTLAYDSAKPRLKDGSNLFQTIDPQSFYTLYGDGSEQKYEAASSEKLYLKLEREQFYALFGDFDTDLSVTELSRYNRSLTGLKAELHSPEASLKLFGSETAQVFVKDEIRGDGTSGLYRLSRNDLLVNSEKITLETRDRFRSELILSSRSLARHLDYDIDYQQGTIFFKEPIFSKDENFNPIFIVVDYETMDTRQQAFNYGGRGAYRMLDEKVEVGASYIHEDQLSGAGDLYGVDTTVKLSDELQLRAELAGSDSSFGGESKSGSAYLAELSHRTVKLEARLYLREQGEEFGLGQQNGAESGTRKMGLDAAYRKNEQLSFSGQAWRQTELATGANRDLAEAQANYSRRHYQLHLGLREVRDELGDGSTQRSDQVTAGGSWNGGWERLTLRLNHDQTLNSGDVSSDFPTRTTLGADYRLSDAVTLFGAQEFSWNEQKNTQNTRVGIKAKANPWKGGQVSSSVEQQFDENGNRAFANLGLKQRWQVNQNWSVDAGLDRSQVLKNDKLNTGSDKEFSAVSVGATYKMAYWSWWNRLEYRDAKTSDRWGLASGVIVEPKQGLGLAAQAQIFDTSSGDGAGSTSGDLRLSLAYRPRQSRWMVLNRVDFIFNEQGEKNSEAQNWKVVNNLNANYRVNEKTQVALQYGAKYVKETIDEANYSGFTDLAGIEARYDINDRWDVGARASVLHSWNGGQLDYSSGVSVGYNVMDNAWVSLGYNFTGFQDQDFSAGSFTAQGPYVQVRVKIDQKSVEDLLGVKTQQQSAAPAPEPAPEPAPALAPAPAVAAEPLSLPEPVIPKALLTSTRIEEPLEIMGSVEMPSLLINGRQAALPLVDIRLAEASEQIIEVRGRQARTVNFNVQANRSEEIRAWSCRIMDSGNRTLRTLGGQGAPPASIAWDGLDDRGQVVEGGEVFHYQVETRLADGSTSTSPRRLFGVHRNNPVSLRLTGGAFAFNSSQLSPQARDALAEIAEILHRHPEEKVVIEGHSDAVGSAAANLAISRRRAETAAAYLMDLEGIAAERLIVRWFGEKHPVASNNLPEGRELNRRVEIKGEFEQQNKPAIRDDYRSTPRVSVNRQALVLDPYGRFRKTLEAPSGSVALAMNDSQGRSIETRIALPHLEIIEPSGTLRLPLGSPDAASSPKELAIDYRLKGRTEPGNRVELDRNPLQVAPDGTFNASLRLKKGTNLFGIMVEKPDGTRRLSHLQIELSLEDENTLANNPGQ